MGNTNQWPQVLAIVDLFQLGHNGQSNMLNLPWAAHLQLLDRLAQNQANKITVI